MTDRMPLELRADHLLLRARHCAISDPTGLLLSVREPTAWAAWLTGNELDHALAYLTAAVRAPR